MQEHRELWQGFDVWGASAGWQPIGVLAQEAGAGTVPNAPAPAGVSGPGVPTEAAQATQDGPAPSGQGSPFGGEFMLILLGLMVFMIVMSMMAGRKEKKRRAAMLEALGRHDRVMTTGGMIGTIVELKGEELVLKVDEASGTRIHFSRGAVQSVIKSSGRDSGGDGEAAAEEHDDALETETR